MYRRNDDGGEPAVAERLRSAFKASTVDGVWEWDHLRRVAIYDSGAARLLAGNAALAERELGADIAMAMVHPDDIPWLREQTVRAAHENGLVLAEYRVLTRDGDMRWILSRGRTEYVDGKPMITRGFLIDITLNRDTGSGYVVATGGQHVSVAEQIADHAIAMKRLIGVGNASPLTLIVDMLLLQAGRELGQQQRVSDETLQ